MRADLRVPSLLAECLSSLAMTADAPKLAYTETRVGTDLESEDLVRPLPLPPT